MTMEVDKKARQETEEVLRAILQDDDAHVSVDINVKVRFDTDEQQADFLEWLREKGLFATVSKIERMNLTFDNVFKVDPSMSSEKIDCWGHAILATAFLRENAEKKEFDWGNK